MSPGTRDPTIGAANVELRHRGFSHLRRRADGPSFAHPRLVLSGVETILAFVIILGALLRPLVLVDKPA